VEEELEEKLTKLFSAIVAPTFKEWNEANFIIRKRKFVICNAKLIQRFRIAVR
jgi:hypothetical protein